MFSQWSAETESVLLQASMAYGSENLEQVEVLDLFNDKRIIFRAVSTGHEGIKGERLAATPPYVQESEVITLD